MTAQSDPTLQNRYTLLGEIGRGGMGCVYKAQDTHLDRIVALKVILDHAKILDFQRFEREAKVLAGLKHPNIVPVLDFGSFPDGRRFLVMPLIEGETLDRWIKSQEDEIAASVPVLLSLARALGYVHSKGIIHRDLKPQNVMICRDTGEPILLDFGLVRPDDVSLEKLTASGVVLGTYSYMAPEQANGGTVDARADIYGLGAILYYCLCGRPPISNESGHYVMMKKIFGEPPVAPVTINEELPQSLNDFCLRCLAKSASQRPQSAEAFSGELAQSWSERGPSKSNQGRMIAAAVSLLLFLIAIGLSFPFTQEKTGPLEQPIVKLVGGIPGLNIYNGDQYKGTINADGTLTVRLTAGLTELSVVRETGERYPVSLRLEAGQDRSLKLRPWGLVNLSANQKLRVTIRNSKGKIVKDRDGRELKGRTLPLSTELIFGQYSLDATIRSQLKNERRHLHRRLTVGPGQKLSQKILVGFESVLPKEKVWSDPQFVDLNDDGILDLLCIGSNGRQDLSQCFAISGFDGSVLWPSQGNTCYWTRPVVVSGSNPKQVAVAVEKDGQRRCDLWDAKSGRLLNYFEAPRGSKLQWHVGPLPFGEIDLAGGKKALMAAGHSSIWCIEYNGKASSTLKLNRKIKVHLRSQMQPLITDLDRDGVSNDLIVRLCDEIGDSKRESGTREIRAYRNIDQNQGVLDYQSFEFKDVKDAQFLALNQIGIVLLYSYNIETKETTIQFVDPKTFKELNRVNVRGNKVFFAESPTQKRIYAHSYFDVRTRSEKGWVGSKLTVFDATGVKIEEKMLPFSSQFLSHINTPLRGSRLLILSPELRDKQLTARSLSILSTEKDYPVIWRSNSFNRTDLKFLVRDLDQDGLDEVILLSRGKLLVETIPNK